jgi:hypothetical protein
LRIIATGAAEHRGVADAVAEFGEVAEGSPSVLRSLPLLIRDYDEAAWVKLFSFGTRNETANKPGLFYVCAVRAGHS